MEYQIIALFAIVSTLTGIYFVLRDLRDKCQYRVIAVVYYGRPVTLLERPTGWMAVDGTKGRYFATGATPQYALENLFEVWERVKGL